MEEGLRKEWVWKSRVTEYGIHVVGSGSGDWSACGIHLCGLGDGFGSNDGVTGESMVDVGSTQDFKAIGFPCQGV